jgi:nucleoside-diphosphate-sugar epimerase
MVRIAIAGASGQLSKEILDGLVETDKHEIIGLVRKDPKSLPETRGVRWAQTNYKDRSQLVHLLRGVHTVLCFFISHKDAGGVDQKRLIDAAIEAGVQRYAASEWSIGSKLESVRDAVPWYSSKLNVRTYLHELNQTEKVLEYTLFHPGLFMNYLGYPRQTTKHITLFPLLFDFDGMRAIVGEQSLDAKIAYSTVEDIVGVVARAVEYEGEWPRVGGITGSQVTVAQLLELGKKIRGRPFDIEWVKEEDAQAGRARVSWLPPLDPQILSDVPKEQQEAFQTAIVTGTLVAVAAGAWETTDEWNQILPDYKFTSLEAFLKQVWESA